METSGKKFDICWLQLQLQSVSCFKPIPPKWSKSLEKTPQLSHLPGLEICQSNSFNMAAKIWPFWCWQAKKEVENCIATWRCVLMMTRMKTKTKMTECEEEMMNGSRMRIVVARAARFQLVLWLTQRGHYCFLRAEMMMMMMLWWW